MVIRLADHSQQVKRIGSLKGQVTVPDDIKTPFADEIEKMFYGEE